MVKCPLWFTSGYFLKFATADRIQVETGHHIICLGVRLFPDLLRDAHDVLPKDAARLRLAEAVFEHGFG